MLEATLAVATRELLSDGATRARMMTSGSALPMLSALSFSFSIAPAFPPRNA
jgi:hypothetical protein